MSGSSECLLSALIFGAVKADSGTSDGPCKVPFAQEIMRRVLYERVIQAP